MPKQIIRREDIPEALIRDLKILNALPPYDDGSNICAGDGYFSNQIKRTYSAAMISAANRLVISPMVKELDHAKKTIERKYR